MRYLLTDVKEASSQELFTVISTFAGGGGSSTGYRLAGGKVLAFNEFVDEAVRTYLANYPDTPVLPGDIKTLSGEDFLREARVQKGVLDILDGSPPCSAFSIAGKRDKGWVGGKRVDVRKEDIDGVLEMDVEYTTTSSGVKSYSTGKVVAAIEDLFIDFIRIAKDIQPRVIIAENVKGITFGPAQGKLNEFLSQFEDLGYQVAYKVMNAADYGVPQARERTLIVSVRDDVADAIGLNWINMDSIFPEPTTPIPFQPSLQSALLDVENDPAQVQELLDYVQGGFQKKWIELLPFWPDRHMKPSDKDFIKINPKRSLFNMIRPNADMPSPTITQRGNQKSVSGVFHPGHNRKFTIPELKRIMSLPEDFILTGDFDKQAERIGRMVCPLMMKALAESIYEKVLKPYHETVLL